MSRRPDHLGKRKDFSQRIKQEARKRANWTCEYPGCDASAHEVDHILAEGLGGASSLQNAQVLCEHHHKQKTKLDAKIMAKADRMGVRSGQQARRKKAKANGTYRPIQSRGFSKTHRRKMDGTVKEIEK